MSIRSVYIAYYVVTSFEYVNIFITANREVMRILYMKHENDVLFNLINLFVLPYEVIASDIIYDCFEGNEHSHVA